MVLGSGLLVPGMGAPSGALEHEFWAFGKEWVGVVVRVALADSVCGSLGSKPLRFLGEPGCEHSSPSHLRSVPMKTTPNLFESFHFPSLFVEVGCVGVHGRSGWKVRIARVNGCGLEVGVGWSGNG